jgi:hypothetical protein
MNKKRWAMGGRCGSYAMEENGKHSNRWVTLKGSLNTQRVTWPMYNVSIFRKVPANSPIHKYMLIKMFWGTKRRLDTVEGRIVQLEVRWTDITQTEAQTSFLICCSWEYEMDTTMLESSSVIPYKVVKWLPSKHEALSSNSSTAKKNVENTYHMT